MASVIWLVLSTTVSVGLDGPSRVLLPLLPVPGGPSYSSSPNEIRPLTDTFIARALGLPPPAGEAATPAATPAGPSIPAATSLARRAITHPPTNDDLEDAYVIDSVPFSARTDASNATSGGSDPSSSCAPAGTTLWYRYRPTDARGLVASIVATTDPVALTVFAGQRHQEVGCHTDVLGRPHVAFAATAGTTYWFQIAFPAGGGRFGFNLDPVGLTERVSVSSQGEEANSISHQASLSGDGRYVAFESWASDLVPGDTNEALDVFVHDRVKGATERVSVDSSGNQGDLKSGDRGVVISANGRYVAFHSRATNLVRGDTNDWPDVFVHDRLTGRTERVSVDSDGKEGRAPRDPTFQMAENSCTKGRTPDLAWTDERYHRCTHNRGLAISPNGRFIAYESMLVGLVDGDEEDEQAVQGLDVFVHDRRTGETTLVSVSSSGSNANDWSDYPAISDDGRYVAFRSFATNLSDDSADPAHVPASMHSSGAAVYVHDRQTARTETASVSSDGVAGDDESWGPAISGDGRYVAFSSLSSNLVDDDRNQASDVFVHDRKTGATERVSVSSTGEEQQLDKLCSATLIYSVPCGASTVPSISADGRYVAFESEAPNLAPGDSGDSPDIFVHDRLTGWTMLVSVADSGVKGDAESQRPVISADGRHVAFESWASNLVAEDTNHEQSDPLSRYGRDIFVHTMGWFQ